MLKTQYVSAERGRQWMEEMKAMIHSSAGIRISAAVIGFAVAGLLVGTADADLITNSTPQYRESMVAPYGDPDNRKWDGGLQQIAPALPADLISHGNWIIPGDEDDSKGAYVPGGPDQMVTPFETAPLPGLNIVVVPRDFGDGKTLWDAQFGNNGSMADPLGAWFDSFGDTIGDGFRDETLPPIPAPQTLLPLAFAMTCVSRRRRRL